MCQKNWSWFLFYQINCRQNLVFSDQHLWIQVADCLYYISQYLITTMSLIQYNSAIRNIFEVEAKVDTTVVILTIYICDMLFCFKHLWMCHLTPNYLDVFWDCVSWVGLFGLIFADGRYINIGSCLVFLL